MLTLTPGQQETLRLLGQDSQPLHLVRIDVGRVLTFDWSGSQPGGETLWVQHSDFETGTSGLYTIPAEPDPNAAAAAYAEWVNGRSWPPDEGAWDNSLSCWAWSRGPRTYVRLPSEDLSRLLGVSGTAVSAGRVVQGLAPGPEYLFASGGADLVSGDEVASAGVADVGYLAAKLDPKTNKVAHRKRELVLEWSATVEEMATETIVVGATVTVTRGLAGRDFEDWIPSGVYVVTDGPFPAALGLSSSAEERRNRPRVSFVLEDRMAALLRRAQLGRSAWGTYEFVGLHPLEHCLAIMDGVAGVAGDLIDRASFDPSASQWEGVAHHCVSNVHTWIPKAGGTPHWQVGGPYAYRPEGTHEAGFAEGSTAGEALDQLLLVVPGFVTTEEDGLVRARRNDPGTIEAGQATIRDWSEVFAPDTLSDLMADQVTQVILAAGGDWDSESKTYWERNAAFDARQAQAAFAHRSIGRLIKSWELKSKFYSGVSYLNGGLPDDEGYETGPRASLTQTSTEFRIKHSQRLGFAGSRATPYLQDPASGWAPAAGSVVLPPTWARLSSTQSALIHLSTGIGGWAADGIPRRRVAATEIIRCDSVRLDTAPGNQVWPGGQDNLAEGTSGHGYGRLVPWGMQGIYQIAERGWGGTDSPDFWLAGCPVTDVTIAEHIASRVLNTHGWGFPRLPGTTDLGQMDVQIGDLVAVPLPHLLGFGGVGAAGLSMTFQVLAKSEEQGRMRWELGLAYRGGASVHYLERPVPVVTRGGYVPPILELTPSGEPTFPVDVEASASGSSTGAATPAVIDNSVISAVMTVANMAGLDVSRVVSPDFKGTEGADRQLVVFLAEEGSAGVSGVTWGGQALTQILSESDGTVSVEAWRLDATGIAAATDTELSISHAGTTYSAIAMHLLQAPDSGDATYSGVHPTMTEGFSLSEGGLALGAIVEAGGVAPSVFYGREVTRVPIGTSVLYSMATQAPRVGVAEVGATFAAQRDRAGLFLSYEL